MKNARPLLIKFIGAAAVFGVVFVMAATLNVNGQTLGAGSDSTVAACDTVGGVKTGYTPQWDATAELYEVATVTVSDIDDTCDGKAMKVRLVDSTGASLGEGTATVNALALDTTDDVTITGGASAEAVTGVHVVIAD